MSLTVVTALCHAQGARSSVCLSSHSSQLCVYRTFVTVLRELTRIRQGRRGASAEPQQPSRPSASHPRLTAKRPKGQGQRSMLHDPGAIPAKSVSAEPYLETVVW